MIRHIGTAAVRPSAARRFSAAGIGRRHVALPGSTWRPRGFDSVAGFSTGPLTTEPESNEPWPA